MQCPQLCTHAPAGGGAARPPGGEPGWFNFLCFPCTHAPSWRPRITSRCRRGRCSRPQFAAAAEAAMTQAFPWAVAAHRGLASGEALNMGVGMVGVLKYPFFF